MNLSWLFMLTGHDCRSCLSRGYIDPCLENWWTNAHFCAHWQFSFMCGLLTVFDLGEWYFWVANDCRRCGTVINHGMNKYDEPPWLSLLSFVLHRLVLASRYKQLHLTVTFHIFLFLDLRRLSLSLKLSLSRLLFFTFKFLFSGLMRSTDRNWMSRTPGTSFILISKVSPGHTPTVDLSSFHPRLHGKLPISQSARVHRIHKKTDHSYIWKNLEIKLHQVELIQVQESWRKIRIFGQEELRQWQEV